MTSLLQSLAVQATTPAPPVPPQAIQHHISLQTALNQMATQTPDEISAYCKAWYNLLQAKPPDQAASSLLQYNETVRKGSQPAINTSPWYIAVINDKPQILTALDSTTPGAALALPNSSPAPAPVFPAPSPFTTSPLLMTIGDRPTPTDTWTYGAFHPDELFGTTAKPQQAWHRIAKLRTGPPLDHARTTVKNDTTAYNIVPLWGKDICQTLHKGLYPTGATPKWTLKAVMKELVPYANSITDGPTKPVSYTHLTLPTILLV